MIILRYGPNVIVRAVVLPTVLFLLAPKVGGKEKNAAALSEHGFLRPYIVKLERETPRKTLNLITTMTESDLVLLQHG